jgi:hypothetical protein
VPNCVNGLAAVDSSWTKLDFTSKPTILGPMQTVRLSFLLAGLEVLLVAGCAAPKPVATKPRMTKAEVLKVAKEAMVARFPDSVAGHEPYHAEFREGTWSGCRMACVAEALLMF